VKLNKETKLNLQKKKKK